jgi:hypothetical protein
MEAVEAESRCVAVKPMSPTIAVEIIAAPNPSNNRVPTFMLAILFLLELQIRS